MAYYLSKRNEAFLNEFLPLLQSAKDSIHLETNDPERLLYIIRNAAADPKYSWLGKKFIFSKKPVISANGVSAAVLCKIREVTIEVADGIKCVDDRADLVFVVNLLINEKPSAIRFTNLYLTESEFERLEAYCLTNNYKVNKSDKGVTIIHE